MVLASLFIFFLLKRNYAVEQEKDGEYTVTKKFFRLSKAAEFLKEQQNVSRIQIRNTWRRDDICIVYKFVDGAESSEFATQKEAKTLKKVLGYVVPEEVLL